MDWSKCVLLLCCTFVKFCEAGPMTAEVTLCSAKSIANNQCETVAGVTFTQNNIDGPVEIVGKISNFEKKNDSVGFHIHEFGSLNDNCSSAGVHYNPSNQSHGAPWDKIRHVGDLGNLNFTTNSTDFTFNFTDSLIKLNGPNSIIGRALVVHSNVDDYGKTANSSDSLKTGNAGTRIACGVIGIKSDYNVIGAANNNTLVIPIIATANLYSVVTSGSKVAQSSVVSQVTFVQNKTGGPVTINGTLDPFMTLSVTAIGFHVHEYGSLFNACLSAGAHYNPANQSHGAPWDKMRHIGDLGNINLTSQMSTTAFQFSDSMIQLYGPNSIIGRAIVIHNGTDDYGANATADSDSAKSGNAGVRIACGVIGLVSDTKFLDPATTTAVAPTTAAVVTTTKATAALTTKAGNGGNGRFTLKDLNIILTISIVHIIIFGI